MIGMRIIFAIAHSSIAEWQANNCSFLNMMHSEILKYIHAVFLSTILYKSWNFIICFHHVLTNTSVTLPTHPIVYFVMSFWGVTWLSGKVIWLTKHKRESEGTAIYVFCSSKKPYCQYAAGLINKCMQLNTCYKALTLPLRKKQPQVPTVNR